MTTRQLSPELKNYYQIRYQKLIEEIRQIAALLDIPDPIPNRKTRRQRVEVDVKKVGDV